MTATLMLGKPLADRIRAEVAGEVAALGHVGLVTVLVGDDPASEIYIRLKHQAAHDAGIAAKPRGFGSNRIRDRSVHLMILGARRSDEHQA